MQISVIGAGSWGTALAKLLAEQPGNHVTIWSYEEEVAHSINQNHVNDTYLDAIPLPHNLTATTDLEEALFQKEMLLLVTPSHVIRRIMTEAAPFLPAGVPIVSATKGIENDSLMMISEILEEVLPDHHHPYFCFLSGPSFAREVATHKPTAVTVASYNMRLAERVQHIFSTQLFRVYSSNDVVGVEVGGALKNVIAIASGGVSALDLGHNATAALITRGLAEITRLAVRMGANPLTLAGLSGMGDLVLTCTGGLSRNRTLGYKLGEGKRIEQVLSEMKMVAEGVKTSRSVHDLATKLNVEMPICEQVYLAVHEGKDGRKVVEDIMGRSLKREMTGVYG